MLYAKHYDELPYGAQATDVNIKPMSNYNNKLYRTQDE